VIFTTLPKAVCSLNPSKTGWGTVDSGVPSVAVPLAEPPGAGRFGSSASELANTTGASRMANDPRPNVVASRTFGSPAWATERPVVGSTLPVERSRSVTWASGRPPPAPGVVGWLMMLLGSCDGKSDQVCPLSSDR